MSKLTFASIAEDSVTAIKSDQEKLVNKLTTNDFVQLKDRTEGSKAEIVMVGVRMTKAERRQLRAMAGQLEIPIQDIIREGIALFRAKQGVR